MTLRVLHLAASSVDTSYFATLVPALVEYGLEVECGTLQHAVEPAWITATDGVAHFELGARGGPGPWWLPAVARLVRRIRTGKIDIVQTHLFEPGIVGVISSRITRRPVIVTRHHTDEMHIVGTWAHILGDRATARAATRVLGFSDAVRDHLVEREGMSRERVEVIHQGFAFDTLQAEVGEVERVRSELNLNGRFVIGDVARFFVTKGHVDLLRAARRLSETIENLTVLLVGGGDLNALRALAESEGVGDRTVIAGHRLDVPACLGAMEVVVHPSITEAFCQVLIESMAVGRPLIATNVAGAPEVVDNERTGLLVPPHDPEAIAAAVERLHANPRLRMEMGEAGRRSVRERFPVAEMVSKQHDLYKSIMRGWHD